MKAKLILTIAIFIGAFSSCTKCVTCVPYKTDGVTISTRMQTVRSCSKADITAYENGLYTETTTDTVIFHCN